MAPRVILLRGLPGSGKTTWARRKVGQYNHTTKRVCRDDLRAMFDNGVKTTDNEKFILSVRDKIILEGIRDGKHVIVDDTNLNPIHETHIRSLVGPRVDFDVVSFTDVSVEDCVARDASRTDMAPKGEHVIRKMAAEWNRWSKVVPKIDQDVAELAYKYDFEQQLKPPVVICDLDGTLAHGTNRSMFDYTKVKDDDLDDYVAYIVGLFAKAGMKIIMVTGRESWCKDDTRLWLDQHGVPYHYIYMRESGDKRPDIVIKSEIYRSYIEPSFSVFMVLEDRSRVVKMWRDTFGLRCMQVSWGDF